MSDNTIMTQEQIEEMLRNAGQVDAPAAPAADLNIDSYFSQDEQDALGEMGNICMGTAATTMYTLLSKQVMITTPSLSIHTWETLAAEHPLPLVVVEVQYTKGIDGNNLLLLKEFDVALITDLLMGGEGNIDPNNVVLDEISLSAIREVMNQMVGSSATSLAQMLMKTIDISTPESKRIIMSEERITDVFPQDGRILKIAFRMEIEGLLESEIMQVFPVDFAQAIAQELLNPTGEDTIMVDTPAAASDNVYTQAPQDVMPEQQPAPPVQQAAPPPPAQQAPPPVQQQQVAPPPQQPPQQDAAQQQGGGYPPPYPYPPYPPYPQQGEAAPYPYPPYGYPQPQYQPPYPAQAQQVPQQPYNGMVRDASTLNVREVDYPTFGMSGDAAGLDVANENLWRLLDVPMEITVELGRSKKTVKQVLDLNIGSVVVLDKLAGELVEIMVNGIQVARGEVVVIDDSYGVRITELNAAKLNEITRNGE